MSGPALRHFVEEALGRHTDDFDDWFPACFHWRGLCADAPQMVAGFLDRAFDPDDLEYNEAVRDRAERVFRFGHVAALAVLSAASVDETDPLEALDLLLEPPDTAAEARFQALVSEVLGPLEAMLAGETQTLDARGEEAYQLVDAAWPAIEQLAREDGVLGEDTQPFPGTGEAERQAVGSILGSLVLVAVMLAAFRWMSEARTPGA